MIWENKSCPVDDGCSYSFYSCRYLKFLDNKTMIKVSSKMLHSILNLILFKINIEWRFKFLQDYYPDPESAMEAVRRGQAWGTLYFTENFTDALVARIGIGRDSDEETLDQSEIRVWLDMSSKSINFSALLSRDSFPVQVLYTDRILWQFLPYLVWFLLCLWQYTTYWVWQ